MSEPRIYVALGGTVLCLTPKVASSSIISALLTFHGITEAGVRHLNPALPFMGRSDVEKHCRGWKTAMFVRNPFDRLVSAFAFHIVQTRLKYCANMRWLGFTTGMGFDAFAAKVLENTEADPHYALQSRQFAKVDFVGRIEDIGADWRRFREFTGLDLPDLGRVGLTTGKHDHYRAYYSPGLRGRVETAYRADLEAFGYEF